MSGKTGIKYFKNALVYYTYLLIVWGFYRLLFQAPSPFEELIIKPAVWLIPLYVLIRKEKISLSDIGVRFENFFRVVYFVLALGFIFSIFAVLVNYLKYNGLNFAAYIGETTFWGALGLSLITAISEELPFRGYLLARVEGVVKDASLTNLIISVGWTLIHIPIAILDWKLEFSSLLLYIAIVFIFSVGTTFVYMKTKNIVAPVLLHVLWQWPIILFR